MEKFKLTCNACNSEHIDIDVSFKRNTISNEPIVTVICNDCGETEQNY